MILKKILFTTSVVFLFFVGTVFGQDNASTNLQKDAASMVKSILEEDYASYIDLTNTAAIEVFGGKDIMIKMVKTNKDALKDAGMILQTATLNSVSDILNNDANLQAIVTFDYITLISGAKYKGQNFLHALSEDDGQNWTFLELETFDEESIKTFIPNYNVGLTYPQIIGAVFIEDEK